MICKYREIAGIWEGKVERFQRKRNMRADCGDMAGAAYVSTAAKYGFRRGGLRLLSGENRAVSGKIAG